MHDSWYVQRDIKIILALVTHLSNSDIVYREIIHGIHGVGNSVADQQTLAGQQASNEPVVSGEQSCFSHDYADINAAGDCYVGESHEGPLKALKRSVFYDHKSRYEYVP